MKPTLHGINQLSNVIVTRIPSDKINVNALIETFESNQDKATPTEWLQQYDEISSIYKILFTEGELPQEMIDKTSHEVLEMACEHISHDLEELIEEPTTSNGRDYYYEFGRSLGVEEQASKLKEHLAEDCDFYMINNLEAGYYRDTLRYYSYVKTQTHINKFVEYPRDIVEPTYISLGEQMSFCNYIPEVLENLTSSTCLDYPNEAFGRCIGNIQGNVQDHCPIEVAGIFHFGLLLDHLHLFTEAEETELKVRIDDMFHNLGDVCMSFKEFYETYFASQFFGGYSSRYTQFEKHMEYTYILWCDFEFHTTEEFGPRFMGAYSKFAEEYYEFYKELVDEIQRRKQVDAC